MTEGLNFTDANRTTFEQVALPNVGNAHPTVTASVCPQQGKMQVWGGSVVDVAPKWLRCLKRSSK